MSVLQDQTCDPTNWEKCETISVPLCLGIRPQSQSYQNLGQGTVEPSPNIPGKVTHWIATNSTFGHLPIDADQCLTCPKILGFDPPHWVQSHTLGCLTKRFFQT